MASPRYPTQQYLAGDFVISAGCILFRHNHTSSSSPSSPTPSSSSSKALEICILHHLRRDEWLLPKGRKDRGETIEQTAVRETYEETGYQCRLWPRRMPTRAPVPGGGATGDNIDDSSTQVVDELVEPIGITIRDLGRGDMKLIFWFIAKVEDGVDKAYGTQMPTEDYESLFVDAQEAAERLTYESDRDIVRRALALVVSS